MRLGLRGRILLLVLVALAPPTAVALLVAIEERDEARSRAQADVLNTARVAAADVRRVMTGAASILGAYARDVAEDPDRRSCERLVGLLPRATTRYSSIGVARPGGKVYCAATGAGVVERPGRIDVAGTGWFRAAQERNEFVIGDLRADPVTGRRALVAAQPILSVSGAKPSILFGAVDIRSLSAQTALKDVPRGTRFILFDHLGRVIARVPRVQGAVGRPVPEQRLVATARRSGQGTTELAGADGVKRIQGFVAVGGPAGDRLFVTAGRASEAVFADPNADLRRFVVLALLGLVVALALAYLAAKLLIERWTSAIVDSARRFGAGDLTARAPVPRGLGELSYVAHALNTAAEEIERRQREQAALLAELVAVEEETRRRIAADIHDDTAQAVAAAGLRIDALIAELEDPEARATGVNARQALAEANRRLRRLLFELRPPALDEAGLAAALELYLSDGFGSDGCRWNVDNRLDTEPSPEVRAVLYRVALEALTNVRKHAQANSVEVLLERHGVGVAIRVHDDGRGFDLPAPDAPADPGHIGLVSMRERAEAAGGRFSLASRPGRGTTVEFWMPERNGRPSR
jgi:signal transduction histidine kinase